MAEPYRTIRDRVEAVLSADPNLLGTYTFGSSTVPAIAVVPPAVSRDRTVTGLEVIIGRSPEIENNPTLGSRHDRVRFWSVRLVQYDDDDTTEAAVERLLDEFEHIQLDPLLEATDEIPEQRVLRVSDGGNSLARSPRG